MQVSRSVGRNEFEPSGRGVRSEPVGQQKYFKLLLFDWKLSKAVQHRSTRPYDKPETTETKQPPDYVASNTAGKADTVLSCHNQAALLFT